MTTLTMGMATFRDHDLMTATLVSIHADRVAAGLVEDVELIVVDNEPNGPDGADNKNVVAKFPNARYVPAGEITGTSAPRNRVFSEARGEWVLCLDSHVFLLRGVLPRLVDFCRANPTDSNLHQGPLYREDLTSTVWTHWAEEWGPDGMFGRARNLPPEMLHDDAPAVAIGLAGLGLFLCRKAAWLPFCPHQRHFGGEEGTAHERFRQAGRAAMLQPWLKWWHKFRRQAGGAPFPTDWLSRASNYLHTYKELGYPDLPAIRTAHVQNGRVTPAQWADLVKRLGVVPRPRGNSPGILGAGPGTELVSLFASLGIVSAADCPCKARAKQMDEWGLDACRTDRRDEILTWIREGAAGVGWLSKLWTLPLALKNGLALRVNWIDPAPGLLDLALEAAAAKVKP